VVFEVSDTGCGMPPEQAGRIFERLYQVDGTVQTSRKGLGLGLFISKESVVRQGGTIWVESEVGVGSTFSFTVPVFSLDGVIAPLLQNDLWPTGTVTLVMVEACLQYAWPSKEFQEEWSREVRALVQRCLLPNLDVLLPRVSRRVEGERFFVVAFADDKGASVLVKRIREQFERAPELLQKDLAISYTLLKSFLPDAGASTADVVTALGAALEEAIKAQTGLEAVYE